MGIVAFYTSALHNPGLGEADHALAIDLGELVRGFPTIGLAQTLSLATMVTAFRKQLSRARVAFAQTLIEEVEQTIESPPPEAVMEELAEVGLLEYVRHYLFRKRKEIHEPVAEERRMQ